MSSAGVPAVLREYAVLADGERGAVVGPHGDIAWLCFPRWHDPSVFSSLVGGTGSYAVEPVEPHVWGGSYEPGSLIWRHRWLTRGSIIECVDALALPSSTSRLVLLRRIVARRGRARVRVRLDLRDAYGRERPRAVTRRGDSWEVRFERLTMSWTGAADAREDGDGLAMELSVPAGHHHDLVLVIGSGASSGRVAADVAWRRTEQAWQRALPDLRGAAGERDARHACAVLSGLTSSGGGTVAAVTTSLPESAGTSRSYDYRYAWVRDQCYAGVAALRSGGQRLADSSVRFVTERLLADGPHMRPVYTVDGDEVPSESSLDLPGYPGGFDVIGNRARGQFQLDAFGESLFLLAEAGVAGRLDADGRRAAGVAVDVIGARWREPDAGIWELSPRRWTHSRLACVAGLRAAAGVLGSSGRRCDDLATAILDETTRHGLRDDGAWRRSPRDPRVDAALLMPAIRGALPPDDRRTRATAAAVREHLVVDGYVYRFRHGRQQLGTGEGAFLLCGFMMALTSHAAGDHVDAVRWFERTRSACGPPGLFCEEYDVRHRQLRGNLPQAFVHALMLECAVTLGGTW